MPGRRVDTPAGTAGSAQPERDVAGLPLPSYDTAPELLEEPAERQDQHHGHTDEEQHADTQEDCADEERHGEVGEPVRTCDGREGDVVRLSAHDYRPGGLPTKGDEPLERQYRTTRKTRKRLASRSSERDSGHPLCTGRRGGLIVMQVAAPDPFSFILGVAFAAALSTGVFAHASRHGSQHATAWGIATFLAAGLTVPIYFVRYWMRRGARR